jgi:hypothetical protein
MNVERKVLRSISEFSMFKYVLVAYLIIFILCVFVFVIVGLIGWAVLASSGIAFADILKNIVPGMDVPGILGGLGLNLGGGILGIIIFIIVGLIASVFIAAFAVLVTWILNILLRITGGIELRFAPVLNAKSAQAAGREITVEKANDSSQKHIVDTHENKDNENSVSKLDDYNLEK